MLLWVNLSEFIRIAKCTLKFSDFVPKAKQLFLRMISQGANQVNLLKQTKKSNVTTSLFITFSVLGEELITSILEHE